MDAIQFYSVVIIVLLAIYLAVRHVFIRRFVEEQDKRVQKQLATLHLKLFQKGNLWTAPSLWQGLHEQKSYFLQYIEAKQASRSFLEVWVPVDTDLRFVIENRRAAGNRFQSHDLRSFQTGDQRFDEELFAKTQKVNELRVFLLRAENRALIQEFVRGHVAALHCDGKRLRAHLYLGALKSIGEIELRSIERAVEGLDSIVDRLSHYQSLPLHAQPITV